MKKRWMVVPLVLLLAGFMILAACDSDDDKGVGPETPVPNAWDAYVGNWWGTKELFSSSGCTSGSQTFEINLWVHEDGEIIYIYHTYYYDWETSEFQNTVTPVWADSTAAWGDSSITFTGPETASYHNESVRALCSPFEDRYDTFEDVTLTLRKR